MTTHVPVTGNAIAPSKRYRLPGIDREGIAQLSLLETALWPLQGGPTATHTYKTRYAYTISAGRKEATVTVRAPCGLEPLDELVLWGLLGATLGRRDADPVLLATPYWMLRRLGLETGGSQYASLRNSLLRLAVASYQNDGFFNPETKEHEFAAFQFLSILLPTIGGVGKTVDNERSWRVEWNPAFFRFCQAMGGNLLFDLDLYRQLTPAARRLFLKLKDRFWRSKRVFLNVDDLTLNGLGFSASRSLAKRKFDLLGCIRELLDHRVVTLGRGQTDPKELFQKRGKGSYVVVLYEGDYFRQPVLERVLREKNATATDPLYEPLRRVGVDGPAIGRLLKSHSHSLIQRWVGIAEAAMHEKPRGFPGFRVSPAAFLIDGVQNRRTPPDWWHAHEKRQERRRWEQARGSTDDAADHRVRYDEARGAALKAFLASPAGRDQYERAFGALLAYHNVTDPHRSHEAAHEAAVARVDRAGFAFPNYTQWVLTQHDSDVTR